MLLGFIFSINLYCYMCPTSIWLCSVPNLLPYRFHWYLLSTCEAIFHRLWHNNNMMYKKSWKDHEWSVLLCDNNIECLNCLLCTSNDAISDLCIFKIKKSFDDSFHKFDILSCIKINSSIFPCSEGHR